MIAKDPALDRRIWMLAWPLLLSNITAPLLGLRPQVEGAPIEGISLAAN